MAKFIRVTNIDQGIDFVKTPFADGTNRIYVRPKEIEKLEKILLEGENNG